MNVGAKAEMSTHEKISDSMEEQELCTICNEQLNIDQNVLLECLHKFHSDCLARFARFTRKCPICQVPPNILSVTPIYAQPRKLRMDNNFYACAWNCPFCLGPPNRVSSMDVQIDSGTKSRLASGNNMYACDDMHARGHEYMEFPYKAGRFRLVEVVDPYQDIHLYVNVTMQQGRRYVYDPEHDFVAMIYRSTMDFSRSKTDFNDRNISHNAIGHLKELATYIHEHGIIWQQRTVDMATLLFEQLSRFKSNIFRNVIIPAFFKHIHTHFELNWIQTCIYCSIRKRHRARIWLFLGRCHRRLFQAHLQWNIQANPVGADNPGTSQSSADCQGNIEGKGNSQEQEYDSGKTV